MKDYIDKAKTGTNVNRENYQKMMSDLDKNPDVTCILVHKFDRLHRSARGSLNDIYDLEEKGIRILDSYGRDSTNPKHRAEIRIKNGCPAIVSEELFNKAQERLKDSKNKIRNHNGKNYYPMNGKIFCKQCGSELKGKVQYSRTNKDNKPTKQYKLNCRCQAVKTVNEKYLDDMIIYGLIRVYFCWDDEIQKIIIGSMPGHLATVKQKT